MNFADTIRGLWRRWYIVLPGLVIAASFAVGAWHAVPPGYERSSTQLLLPGADSMPEAANPYLFLGGLSPAADVLVRVVGSENILNDVVAKHPGVEIKISRDTTTAGPVILIVVTASSDAAAEEVLGLLVERTATALEDLQQTEEIAVKNQLTVLPLTVDSQSSLQQRSQFIATGAAGLVGIALTLFIAGLVDGFSLQLKRRRASADSTGTVTGPPHGALDASNETNPVSAAPRRPKQTRQSRPSTAFDQSSYDGDSDAATSPLRSAR